MNPVRELLVAIEGDPLDLDSQLVLADHLLAQGDERGELLVLDCRERSSPGGLHDAEAIERLLLLAAEYTFPRARDVHDVLSFVGSSDPVVYETTHDGTQYRVSYQRRRLAIRVQPRLGTGSVIRCRRNVVDRVRADGAWTDDETNQILRVISDAIVFGAPLADLQFPVMTDALPVYPAGAVRCYRLPLAFVGPRRISPTRYGLAARDHARWHAIWRRLQQRPASTA